VSSESKINKGPAHKRVYYYWFAGIPFLEVLRFFIKGIRKGDIQARSEALAFSFFLALFPSIIFLFTLIPYIPIENFQKELFLLIQSLLPSTTFNAVRETLLDIINIKHTGILSLGFIFALYFSTNGFFALINSFNKSYHGFEKRAAWKQRLISLFLTLLVSTLVIMAIALLVGQQVAIKFMRSHHIVNRDFYKLLIDIGKWIIVVALCFFAIACMYYFGPSREKKFQFFSPGATFATLLIILTSLIFNYYVSNFANYNKLYGSIGTLIIVMLYIQFNSMMLLLGFEFNASIDNVQKRTVRQQNTIKSFDTES
jgi:membrane protein